MARPITALQKLHKTRIARWLNDEGLAPGESVKLSKEQINTLQATVGRELTAEQIEGIGYSLVRIERSKQKEDSYPSEEEIKRHLNALAKIDNPVLGFENADIITRARIYDALFAAGQLNNPTAEGIRKAAQFALDNLSNIGAGRNERTWRTFAARAAVDHYLQCGGNDMGVWAGGDEKQKYMSPLVRWTAVFIPHIAPSKVARILKKNN